MHAVQTERRRPHAGPHFLLHACIHACIRAFMPSALSDRRCLRPPRPQITHPRMGSVRPTPSYTPRPTLEGLPPECPLLPVSDHTPEAEVLDGSHRR